MPGPIRARDLPDEPGVYFFRDERGDVIYVGKAKSIRKRIGSHLSAGAARQSAGHEEMVARARSVDCVVLADESEALFSEQAFIKQYRPRYNVRLRDDKSYPYIAISLDEAFPRVYFTRERHRQDRAYFGPYSSARRVRATLEVLERIFMYRSCTGAEPGRRSGSPCLDYYIKRCQAPCVGYVGQAEYRQAIDSVCELLGGRYTALADELEQRMRRAAAAEEFEQATVERNRLSAVRSLMARRQVLGEVAVSLDAIAVAVEGADANAQVLQVRDGVLSDRQSFYLTNASEEPAGAVAEQFILQYYGEGRSAAIPALLLVPEGLRGPAELARALRRRRGGGVRLHTPRRGEKLKLLELAERNALLALAQERLRSERTRQERIEALDGLQRALDLPAVPMRIECFDISNLMGSHTVASMVVFEGGRAKRSDYRRFAIRDLRGPDDFRAMAEVVGRRYRNFEQQGDISPHDRTYDSSFAALPDLIVIDGGRGQLGAALEPLAEFRERGVTVVALAKRLEEIHLAGAQRPLLLDHRRPELKLLQRLRDEAHRFAITYHRGKRDHAMTGSLLDGLSGVGPARKRALLAHFGSPEAVAAASGEQLAAVPGLPGKVAREIHAQLHRAG